MKLEDKLGTSRRLWLYPLMLAALLATSAQAQLLNHWWGLDAYTTLTYTTTSINVPTGYWNGGYPYIWGGYNWPANQGWWYPLNDPNVSPYVSRYGLGWGGYAPWWGFTDWYDYRYSSLTAQTAYTWSWYGVHPDRWCVLDVYTGVNGLNQVIPFNVSIMSSVTWSAHYWSINGGQFIGQFGDVEWVTANPAAITSWMTLKGAGADDIASVLGSQVMLDAIFNNDNGAGTGVIGLQCIPEPTTVSLLLLGGLALMIKRKH